MYWSLNYTRNYTDGKMVQKISWLPENLIIESEEGTVSKSRHVTQSNAFGGQLTSRSASKHLVSVRTAGLLTSLNAELGVGGGAGMAATLSWCCVTFFRVRPSPSLSFCL